MIHELEPGSHPDFDQALGWIGLRVDDVFGTTIGTVADVVAAPTPTNPRWLLLRGGRFGGRYTLVPSRDAVGRRRQRLGSL